MFNADMSKRGRLDLNSKDRKDGTEIPRNEYIKHYAYTNTYICFITSYNGRCNMKVTNSSDNNGHANQHDSS